MNNLKWLDCRTPDQILKYIEQYKDQVNQQLHTILPILPSAIIHQIIVPYVVDGLPRRISDIAPSDWKAPWQLKHALWIDAWTECASKSRVETYGSLQHRTFVWISPLLTRWKNFCTELRKRQVFNLVDQLIDIWSHSSYTNNQVIQNYVQLERWKTKTDFYVEVKAFYKAISTIRTEIQARDISNILNKPSVSLFVMLIQTAWSTLNSEEHLILWEYFDVFLEEIDKQKPYDFFLFDFDLELY